VRCAPRETLLGSRDVRFTIPWRKRTTHTSVCSDSCSLRRGSLQRVCSGATTSAAVVNEAVDETVKDC
jgi:hypothetical protein